MDHTCAPQHEHDPFVARLVLDINVCADEDPVTALADLPETILDLMEQLPGLHSSDFSLILGSAFAEGRTRRTGKPTLIQRISYADPILLDEEDE